MENTQKLIEYLHICGHKLYIKDGKIYVTNSTRLSDRVKKLIKSMRDDILEYLLQEESLPLY